MTPSYKPGVNELLVHVSTSSDFYSEENNVMSFEVEKCTSMLVKTVKVIRTKGVELPESWIAYRKDKSSWVFHRTTGTVVRKEHSNS